MNFNTASGFLRGLDDFQFPFARKFLCIVLRIVKKRAAKCTGDEPSVARPMPGVLLPVT